MSNDWKWSSCYMWKTFLPFVGNFLFDQCLVNYWKKFFILGKYPTKDILAQGRKKVEKNFQMIFRTRTRVFRLGLLYWKTDVEDTKTRSLINWIFIFVDFSCLLLLYKISVFVYTWKFYKIDFLIFHFYIFFLWGHFSVCILRSSRLFFLCH